MRKHLILCGLLAAASVGPAFAQSVTGSTSGAGNYGMSGNFGGVSQGSSGIGSSYGASSNAASGSYGIQGNGLPAGVSGLPSVGASGSGSGAAPGLGIGPYEKPRKTAPRM